MRERIDTLLVRLGYARSRELAKDLIKQGAVFVNGAVVSKGSLCFEEEEIQIEVRATKPKYVSRGGFKLEKAVEQFGLSLRGSICMDIGASTGGFTDCMLQNGAAKVYALDVGHGQLAEELLADDRVLNYEDRNFRYMEPADFPEQMDFISADVSFISLTHILPAAYPLLKDGAEMVCLIKPQFEAGKGMVNKKGVVKQQSVHREVILKIATFAKELQFTVSGLTHSPIRGPEGNIEYLIWLKKEAGDTVNEQKTFPEPETEEFAQKVIAMIRQAHMEFSA